MACKRFLVYFLFCFLLTTILNSCHKQETSFFSQERKEQADSLLKSVNDINELQKMLSDYQNTGNREGEMMTTKKLGRLLREANQFHKAIEIHLRGSEVAKTLCDTIEIVQALNNIGTNYRRMSLLDKASCYHYSALQLCEEYHDKKPPSALKNRVVSLNGIGNICLRIEDYHTADSVFRIALDGETQLGSALGQAINLANIGSIFEAKGLTDSARIYYHRSMEKNIKAQSDLGIALCHQHFGNLYEKEGRLDQAKGEYQKIYEMEGKIDAWHWLDACISLARLNHKNGENDKAIALLERAKSEGKSSHSYDHLEDVYHLLHDIHAANHQYDKALAAYKISKDYSDSIVNEKKLFDVQNERIRFENQLRQREVESIKQHYLSEKNIRNILTAAFVLVFAMSVLTIGMLFYSLKQRKRKQQTLQQLENIRTGFFTSITHEFRTPLTVIIGMGERLSLQADLQEETRKMGKTIMRQGHNLLLLINQILDISKIKANGPQQDFQHGDIIGYIHTVVESIRELTMHKHLDLRFVALENRVEMDFIPDYITKIIHNLVSNAIKFTPKDGRVYLTANVENKHLRLCIADNGCGIPKEEVQHIFEMFFQGKSGKVELGTGIGLSLVRQLVEAMKGTIQVHTAESEGCVFVMRFPLQQGEGKWKKLETSAHTLPKPVNLLAEESETDPTENTTYEEEGKPVILIVEDNNDVQRYIGSVLPDFHLHYARNGEEGIEKALRIMPDLIVTDLMMPKMDGLEMSRGIRSSEILNHIPIIAITARCSEEDKIIGIKAGINTYLHKPFNKEELNASIHSLLTQRRIIQEKAFNAANMQGISDIEGLSQEEKKFIVKVMNEVYTQMLKENVNPNELAQSLCMSPRQLNRKIITITGDSLSKYIMHIRMQHAKRLLDSDANLSIAEVAHRCGFNENSNFTRSFKTYYNLTPSQYRRFPKMDEK